MGNIWCLGGMTATCKDEKMGFYKSVDSVKYWEMRKCKNEGPFRKCKTDEDAILLNCFHAIWECLYQYHISMVKLYVSAFAGTWKDTLYKISRMHMTSFLLAFTLQWAWGRLFLHPTGCVHLPVGLQLVVESRWTISCFCFC